MNKVSDFSHITLCPLCDSNNIKNIGNVYHLQPTEVAGIPINIENTSFSLKECTNCKFSFKDPMMSESLLLDCYNRSDSANWGLDVDGNVDTDGYARCFDKIEILLKKFCSGKNKRLLDIGCFNGALLKYLGSEHEKYGVELSEDAAELARKRGVSIIGKTIDDLSGIDMRFDVILSVDLVEHLPDPMPFYHSVKNLLEPDGIFIVLTGDTDSLTWRLLKNRYWYCNLPEHCSFFNKNSMVYISEKIGMLSIHHQHIRHKRSGLLEKITAMTKNIIYYMGYKTNVFGIKPLYPFFINRCGPYWLTAKDHMLHVMKNKNTPV